MSLRVFTGLCAVLMALPLPAHSQPLSGFAPASAEQQRACEARLADQPTPAAFRAHLKALTDEPHPAGTPANDRVRAYLDSVMAAAGLSTTHYPYDLYMPSPESAHHTDIALVTPTRQPLNRQEYVHDEDSFSGHPALRPAWNAYSGSGDVTREVAYANYGRRADFERLDSLGVDLDGKIVVARYGGNFRGFKAKYAEEYGAAGLLLYTDPADGGYTEGLPYPEGRYLSASMIQRGSVLTPLGGDPLTPDGPSLPTGADADVNRLDPADADLPELPVAPLPYGSARKILSRMTGEAVPEGWQGGLPFAYRLTGGSDLTVRLKVDQPKELTRATNVVGTIEGTAHPDEWVILGAHFDAWTFGATDPNSGTAMLLTLAEALGTLADAGCRPARSIKIAHWDAEEYGILGSTEWVEQLEDELQGGAVAYLNADAAVSGGRFGAAAAPSLKGPLLDAARNVSYPGAPDDTTTVYDHLAARTEAGDRLGDLGGGSDHVGFYTYAGVPSASGGFSGTTPVYHSAYDNFAWYKRFADTSFVYGPALARIDGTLALRLANADVLPYDVARYAEDLRDHVETIATRAAAKGLSFSPGRLTAPLDTLARAAAAFEEARAERLAAGPPPNADAINDTLLTLEQAFLHRDGLPFGDQYRSLYASPNPFNGYASWMLPGLRHPVETTAPADTLDRWTAVYRDAIGTLTERVRAATAQVRGR
ncbi:MAG: M28 family peptidase [Salinibacter sp.]|uniref:M28 family peptidase n=1 Tax=Salinibacter sp. TaxID=2065818 RepID=UPI002FC2B807